MKSVTSKACEVQEIKITLGNKKRSMLMITTLK